MLGYVRVMAAMAYMFVKNRNIDTDLNLFPSTQLNFTTQNPFRLQL